MDYQLKNKKALVSGSTAGIGFAIAESLAAEGATVIINGRTEKRVNDAISSIKAKYPTANLIAAPFDLSKKEAVLHLFKAQPSVDILVNNLGIYETKDFADITDEDWLTIFDMNVLSGIRLCRQYLPLMLKKNWGRIVFISSESGLQIPSDMIHYGMTKTAQLAIARGLAETTKGTAVTVNSVLPGPTKSEGIEPFLDKLCKENNKSVDEMEKELFATMRPSSLLERFLTPEEIAAMVTFICSPLASGTNGAALTVEGGIVRSIA